MSAENYYDDMANRLASSDACMDEWEAADLEREYQREETEKALREYSAAVKRYGKALTQLGRRCDE